MTNTTKQLVILIAVGSMAFTAIADDRPRGGRGGGGSSGGNSGGGGGNRGGDRPNRGDSIKNPGNPGRPNPGNPSPGRPNPGPGKPDRPNRGDSIKNPGKPNPGNPGRPNPGNPGNPGRPNPGNPGRPNPGNPGNPGRPNPGNPGKPNPGRGDDHDRHKPGNPGRPNPGNPGRPNPGNPGRPDRGDHDRRKPNPGNPGRPNPGRPNPGRPDRGDHDRHRPNPGNPGRPNPGRPNRGDHRDVIRRHRDDWHQRRGPVRVHRPIEIIRDRRHWAPRYDHWRRECIRPMPIRVSRPIRWYEPMPVIPSVGYWSMADVEIVAENMEFLTRDVYQTMQTATLDNPNREYVDRLLMTLLTLEDAAEAYSDEIDLQYNFSGTLDNLFYLESVLDQAEQTLLGYSKATLVQDEMNSIRYYVNELLWVYRQND